jgi:ubiquinone/menaquinone biosynthesis C-methylase UbiE
MNPDLITTTLLVLSGIFLYTGYKILRENLLFNHQLLASFGKYFYNYLHSHKAIKHIRVSNYGYAPIDEEIANYDPDHQHGLQLYKELVKNHSGYMVTEYCSLVEVGCGKGGGAEFLIKKFKPVSYIGFDYSEVAIRFCNDYYTRTGNISFICANAHHLPLGEESTDVVINVESSHIYKDIDGFFNEVYRILKPGGRLLITDYRNLSRNPIEFLEKKIIQLGFEFEDKKIITKQVHEACTRDSERRKNIIDKHSPWFLKKYFGHYAMLNGSKKSAMLAKGEIVYFIYHLKKIAR